MIRCASALATDRSSDAAFAAVLDRAAAELRPGEPADLALIFATPHHAEGLGRLAAAVRERGLGRHVLGCTAESVVGGGREVECGPAVSLWSARLPGATVRPLRLSYGSADGFIGVPEDLATSRPEGSRALILLGDPFTFPADEWFRGLREEAPGLRVVGGMASAGHRPGENRLVLDRTTYEDGAVGMLIGGPIALRTVVSQGCRSVGRPMIITRAEGHVIRELGRRPALQVLRELYAGLPPEDQERLQQGVHIGRVINEYQGEFRRGDFLVRNILGVDEAEGLGVSDRVRVGQTVQFHVRDAETADEDLRRMLEDVPGRGRGTAGALLFTCNGRGARLFAAPDHDVGVLRELLGPVPAAGFFAMGEIGPIGGENYLHGFTASVLLLGDPGQADPVGP